MPNVEKCATASAYIACDTLDAGLWYSVQNTFNLLDVFVEDNYNNFPI